MLVSSKGAQKNCGRTSDAREQTTSFRKVRGKKTLAGRLAARLGQISRSIQQIFPLRAVVADGGV